MSLEKLREWVGRTQAVEDFAAPFPVRALIATFDEKDPDPETGDALPPLWHWLYFLEAAPLSKVGAGRPCRARRLPAAGAAAAPHVGGQPLRLHRPAAPGRPDDPPLLAHQVGRAQDRHHRRHGVRHRGAHRVRAGRRLLRRGPRHRLSRGGQARRDAARPQARPDRRHLVEEDHGRSGAAVPVFRTHLQRPSHPLRPALCHRHRRLSRPDRSRPVDGHGANRVGSPRQSR